MLNANCLLMSTNFYLLTVNSYLLRATVPKGFIIEYNTMQATLLAVVMVEVAGMVVATVEAMI